MNTRANNPNGSEASPIPARVVVISVQNSDPLGGYPPNVNVAAAISYTVNVQTPNGMVGPFVGAVPSVPRWSYPWLIEAFPDGANLPGGVMDGVVYIDAREERWAAPCGFVPGSQTQPPPFESATPINPGFDIPGPATPVPSPLMPFGGA